jgi:phosphatidate cytidylyltransferase
VLKQRVITALILGLLLLAAMFWLPPTGWAILVVVAVILAANEWGRLAKLSGIGLAFYVALIAAVLAVTIGYGVTHGRHAATVHLAVYGLAAAFWLLAAPLWLWRGWRPGRLAVALAGCAALIPAGLAMHALHALSPATLLFYLALVWLADTSAYFAGKKFGRRKLAPSISPGKTWEGAIGALCGVTLYVVLVSWLSLHLGSAGAYVEVILFGWVLVAVSVEGDLFESAMKRQAGVKDSGTLLPGHGGMLDRIDALTAALPLAALVLSLKSSLLGA